jgi:archaellum component FlaC
MKNFLPKDAEAVTMPAIKREIENAVDELAATCSNQFTRINQRFDGIESQLSGMATKVELRMEIDGLYQNMVRRFDAVDARFDRQDEKFDGMLSRMDMLIVFMRGHEKRIEKLERHAAFA